MKKSLIALGVLAASGVAMAQSSVTLYGVADVGIAKSSGVSTRAVANNTLNNGNSRLGVRGVEDLGGGLKAFFNFEQAVNLADGSTEANTWQRNAHMGLRGGFGELRVGRSLNPSFYGTAAWELTGTANYSAVAAQFGYGNDGARDNALVMYTTPNFGGFTAALGYVFKPNNAVGAGAKYDLNLIYKNGPLAAALTYNDEKNRDGHYTLGASYDFGAFKVAGSLNDVGQHANGRDKKGFSLGASVPVGAFSLTLDVARDTGIKDTDIVLEGKYALSKRTFAYAVYYKDGDKRLVTPGKNNFSVGVRHNF